MSTYTLVIIHVQFFKQILGVRRQTQNNLYGELGRSTMKTHCIVNVIR